jgi:hypothetical protein
LQGFRAQDTSPGFSALGEHGVCSSLYLPPPFLSSLSAALYPDLPGATLLILCLLSFLTLTTPAPPHPAMQTQGALSEISAALYQGLPGATLRSRSAAQESHALLFPSQVSEETRAVRSTCFG